MGLFDPDSPTAPVEAAVALLAYLEDAASCCTYLDTPFSETAAIFEAIERCREDAAALFGVEVDISIQRRDESEEEFEKRTDEALGLEPGEFLDRFRDLLDEGDEGAER